MFNFIYKHYIAKNNGALTIVRFGRISLELERKYLTLYFSVKILPQGLLDANLKYIPMSRITL